MAETPLAKKLNVKPGYQLLVMNAPDGFTHRLEPLPEGARLYISPGGRFDTVLVFVGSQSDLNRFAPIALQAVKTGGSLWFAYPKKTSKIKTDINRDAGWDAANQAGWLPVTQVAIDETWSALRFRPESDIKTITRKRN
jgi:hypothetical protein